MDKDNHMADIVEEVATKILAQREDICKCERCRKAIIDRAISLLSKDISKKDKAYIRVQAVDIQLQVDAAKSVAEAIKYLKNNPLH